MREFGAWRYGRRWVSRRYRAMAHSAVLSLGGAGALAFTGGLVLGASSLAVAGYLTLLVRSIAGGTGGAAFHSIPIDAERSYLATRSDLRLLRIARRKEGPWALDTQRGTMFEGAAVSQALALVLPALNRWGGSYDQQDDAVRLIDESGGSEGYLASMSRRHLERLKSIGPPERLALEMAANEELERTALEGELSLLRAAWREADHIAAIADSLLLPLPVEERLWRMKNDRVANRFTSGQAQRLTDAPQERSA